MSIWPFGKNKNESADNQEADRQEEPGYVAEAETDSTLAATDTGVDSVSEGAEEADPIHDAVNGHRGPFDAGHVNIEDFDFSDFSDGTLNLGSLLVPLPRPSEVQVEMGPEGPKMLHILTEHGRITPVAFAAPSSAGQWRESTKEIAAGMREDGLLVHIEDGPWGREIVGSADGGNGIIRIIGVDGPRWMLRMTLAAPAESAEQMAKLGHEVIARTFVNRGNAPILAGSSLPVALPQPLAEQVQEEMSRRAAMENESHNAESPAEPSE